MSSKPVRKHDEFTFSLGGLTAIASFVPAPVVPDNVFRAGASQDWRWRVSRRKRSSSCSKTQDGAAA